MSEWAGGGAWAGDPVVGGPGGVVWVPLDPAWFTDSTENGSISVVNDFSFSGNEVSCSFGLTVQFDGLVEGMTKRADPTALFALLGTTEARILNGDDTLLIFIRPSGDQKNGAILGLGLTNTNAKAALDGGAVGIRGASVSSEWRAWASNATQDDPALLGTTSTGGVFGSIEFTADQWSNISVAGYDGSETSTINSAMITGTQLAGSSTLRLVLFGGSAFAGAGNSTVVCDVWIGLRAGERGGLPT